MASEITRTVTPSKRALGDPVRFRSAFPLFTLHRWICRRGSIGRPGWRFARRVLAHLVRGSYFPVDYWGGFLFVCPTDEVGSVVTATGVFEPEIAILIRGFVRSGYNFVDVGANIGVHACAAAEARRGDRILGPSIIAFEPVPELFAVLRRNLRPDVRPFVECIPKALSDSTGMATMFLSRTSNRGNNTMADVEDGERSAILVPTSTLDLEIEGALSSTTPMVAKIDVEGFEERAIMGGRRFLGSLESGAIVIEIFPGLLHRAGSSPGAVLRELAALGFDHPQVIYEKDHFLPDGRRRTEIRNLLLTKGEPARQQALSIAERERVELSPMKVGSWTS